MSTYRIPASLAEKDLNPEQFIRVVHTDSQQIVGWCSVKTLQKLLFYHNIEEFHVIPLDAQGNPVFIQKGLQFKPDQFLILDPKINLNLVFQLTVTILTIALFFIHLRGNVSRDFPQVISSEHSLNLKHNHPDNFEGDGKPPADSITGGASDDPKYRTI